MASDTSLPATPRPADEGRVARNRRRRTDAFLAAGLRVVTDEGIEALTMARLAEEMDTAVGAVYRYFPSKGELMAAIEATAIGRLQASLDTTFEPLAAAVLAEVDEPAELVRLLALGRWACAVAERYPAEVRLLQLVSSRRSASVAPERVADLLPAALGLVGTMAVTIDAATAAGHLRAGDGLTRAVLWLTAFGGVFVADDLERYLPEVLGGGRLVRQLTLDLLAGWGAPPDALARIDRAVDDLPPSVPRA